MDLHLTGKTAVVTGGSKGIGLAVVRTLLAEGMNVVAASRRSTPELAATDARHVAVDLSTSDGPGRLVEAAVAAYGGLDVLINNVGIGDTEQIATGALVEPAELADEAWQRTFDLHFYSALRVSRAALPSLVERSGVIVNVSSVSAHLVSTSPVDYSVSKLALNALTKVFAEAYGGRGVRAVTVSPGPVSTGVFTDPAGFIARLARERGVSHEEFAKEVLATLAPSTGRISTPEEVARLIAFVASPNNINGAEYVVDGGVLKSA